MGTIYIDLASGKAALRGEGLHVVGQRWPQESLQDGEMLNMVIPLMQIEQLVIVPQVTMTGALVAELMRRGIGVSIMGQAECLGIIGPMTKAKGGLRMRQYRRMADEGWRLQQARIIVAGKLYNQSYMLRRRQGGASDAVLKQLRKLLKQTVDARRTSELMGMEGMGSALYFGEWAKSLPPEHPFTERTRRPPKDPVNACLSYLAAMCAGEMYRAIVAVGLDPDLGVLHSIEDYRHNLALDLMEPFRPFLVEGITRDIATHGMLTAESFERHEDDGGCYLSPAGRAMIIRRYEQRVNSEFELHGRATSLRRQMSSVALNFKQAVETDGLSAANFVMK